MNKRIKKKRLLAELLLANNLQQEVIEDYGSQLAEVKRELADLRAVVERHTLVTNNHFDQLNKEVEQWLERSKQETEEIRLRANLAEADLLERSEGLVQSFDRLSAENEALRDEVEELKQLKTKKSWFGRK